MLGLFLATGLRGAGMGLFLDACVPISCVSWREDAGP